MPTTGIPAVDQEIVDILSRSGLDYNSFTPGEQECISAKLRTMQEEGKAVDDQAVAIAISTCAPTKVRSMASNFKYAWSKNANGTFNIFDVPVFSKHVRNLGLRPVVDEDGEVRVAEKVVDVNNKWLNEAFERNHTRLVQDGYRGPLHVRHHPRTEDVEDQTEPAGQFVLKPVRSVDYQGEKVPTLFADFLNVPAHIFERIKAGLLPYRSIEALNPNVPEVDSIALLDTDTPWFRYPNLDGKSLGQEIFRQVYRAEGNLNDHAHPLRGFASIGGHKYALCYFAGGQWQEDKDRKPEDKESDKDKDKDREKEPDSDGEEQELFANEENDETINGDEEVDPDEQSELVADGEGDSTMGKILDALTSLAKGQDAIVQALSTSKAPVGTDGGTPVQTPGADVHPIQAKASDDKANGRLAAAEDFIATEKRERSIRARVRETLMGLRRYNLGEDAEDKLFAKASASKDPESYIDGYAEWVKDNLPEMPLTLEETIQAAAKGEEGQPLPEEVKEYAGDVQALERAMTYANLYDEGVKNGMVSRGINKKDFVKYNMASQLGPVLHG